jgi:HPt (histidine-containing phosphotransfer) domain-containing protein
MEEKTSKKKNTGLISGIEIGGINIAQGLERFGKASLLIDILRSYAKNTLPLLDQIRQCTKETLRDYGIIVHGLKSSSYGISAESVGKKAEALENAAAADDLDFILKNNAGLIDETERLIAEIQKALLNIDNAAQRPLKKIPDKEVLAKLLKACIDYDMDGIDRCMSELQEFTYKSGQDLVVWLIDHVEQMDIERIIEKLS